MKTAPASLSRKEKKSMTDSGNQLPSTSRAPCPVTHPGPCLKPLPERYVHHLKTVRPPCLALRCLVPSLLEVQRVPH